MNSAPDDSGAARRALALSRRRFLFGSTLGLGALGLAAAADPQRFETLQDRSRPDPFGARPPHFAPRAKRVIYLHMAGGPTQLDLFDPKPELVRRNGELTPPSLIEGRRFAFIVDGSVLLGSPYRFEQRGEAGAWVSELLPHLAQVSDKVAFVKSMHTQEFNHAPAQLLMQSGFARHGRPPLGAWTSWGLGSENRDLPAFVVMVSGGKVPSAGRSLWSSGFLPSVNQGVELRSEGEPVLFLSNPPGVDRPTRRRTLDALRDLNELALDDDGDPETETRIAQYELAYRMQTEVPGVMDIADEPERVLERYGARPGSGSFANNCLLARRLVERGVRFVQLFDWGWDHHGSNANEDLYLGLPNKCRESDRPVAALLADLDERGLLDETLVVWAGEFGRTPIRENRTGTVGFVGRDHQPECYTVWLAGGGVRPGVTLGETDEFGSSIVRDPVSTFDLSATILHLLGFDHERMTYRFQGRDYRLTDVSGEVVRALLA